MGLCELCGKQISTLYGSGRFCSEKCSRSFSSKAKRQEINKKVSDTLRGRKVGGIGFQVGFDARRYKYQCSACERWFREKEKQRYSVHSLHCKGKILGDKRIAFVVPFTPETRRKGHQTVRERIANLSFEKAPIAEKYRRVFKEQGDKCLHCGVGRVWNGAPLVLEIDHINGVHTDDSRNNLRSLCPNCHSQTPTYKNRGRRRAQKKSFAGVAQSAEASALRAD